jgi:hypothetical protein
MPPKAESKKPDGVIAGEKLIEEGKKQLVTHSTQ